MTIDYSHLPKTRSDALALGITRYFTGKPCGRGHITLRKSANGNCCACLERIRRKYAATERGRERQRAHNKTYNATEKGREVRRLLKAERRAAQKQATPSWYIHEEALVFYRGCPPGHHVDHIIPLENDNFCGLHVIENLQHLPAQENIKKNNKVDPLTLEANICVLPPYRSYVRG